MKVSALAIAAMVVPTVALAEAPSFDCRTARTPREIVVCGDASLAEADRNLTAIYGVTRKRLPAALADRLTGDQREFVGDLDDGFDADLWGKVSVPDDARRMQTDLRRALRERRDAADGLRAEMVGRSRMLAGIVADRPGFAGTWAMHGATLTIAGAGGAWKVVYEHPSYGWPKYACHFTAIATSVGATLVVDGVENTDIGETRQARPTLRRYGAVLTSAETLQEEGGRSACVHGGPVDGTFFAVGR